MTPQQVADAPLGTVAKRWGDLFIKVSPLAWVGMTAAPGVAYNSDLSDMVEVDRWEVPDLVTVPMLMAALADTVGWADLIYPNDTSNGRRTRSLLQGLDIRKGCWPGMLVRSLGSMPWLEDTIIEQGHPSRPETYGVYRYDGHLWIREAGTGSLQFRAPVHVLHVLDTMIRTTPDPSEGPLVEAARLKIAALTRQGKAEYSWCQVAEMTAAAVGVAA